MPPSSSNGDLQLGDRLQKSDLVRLVARDTSVSQENVRRVINALCERIVEACVEENKKVVLYAFGNFELRSRSGRGYLHPREGYKGRSEPSTYLAFQASTSIKSRLPSPESSDS